MARVQFHSHSFWQAKLNNSSDEYEDAFYADEDSSGATLIFRSAIADGATESSFAQQWAHLLVASYGSGELCYDDYAKRLPRLQQRWSRDITSRPLPWYAQEKLSRGAFAAFLGLTLSRSSPEAIDGSWESMAIGDCCMFQVRVNRLIHSWPYDRADQFGDRPLLLPSHPQFNLSVQDSVISGHGSWQLNDKFYLMTDALACWFLRAIGPTSFMTGALKRLSDISTANNFEAYVNNLRKSKQLKNDDTTLICIDVS